MKKKLLTAAIAAAVIAPLAAQANEGPTVYGVAHAAVESLDRDEMVAGDATGLDAWRVSSRQSLLGVKGSEDLGNGLKAVYKMEFQIDITDTNGAGNVTSRNQYVGLAGGWGSLLLGRHDTPMKMMTISRDKFNTTLGDWNEVGFTNLTGAGLTANGGVFQDNRSNNAITYISPAFNGLTVAAQVSPRETDADDSINDDGTSIAAKYVNGPIYIGVGYEDREFNGDDNLAASQDNDDWDTWRVAGSYQIGDFNIGAVYEESDGWAHQDGVDAEVWQISGSYTFGNNVLKVAYQDAEIDRSSSSQSLVLASAVTDSPEFDSWTIGLDHNFSKRTRAYVVYTDTDVNSDAELESLGADWDSFGVGLVHKF